ncbi:MAG: hypothetical protein OEV34_18710, partial [Gammaproteobacteria bacterium]|nr:hypothetical protein [Gammaproteobacteria bacterium]
MDRIRRLRRLWSSITGRLILGVVVMHLVLTPILFYGILLIVERSFESRFVDQVRKNTLLYAELLRPIVERGDVGERETFLYETKISGDVVYAGFADSQGIASGDDPDSSGNDLVFQEDFDFGQHADQVYFIAAPLFSESNGTLLGFLRLG